MDSVSKIFTNFNLYDNHMKLSFLKVNAESPPKAVHLWHANTFWNNRRDFRIASLDKPCLTGPVVSIAGYDNLCSNLYVIWTAEVFFTYSSLLVVKYTYHSFCESKKGTRLD